MPMPPYAVLCYRPGCGRPAVHKVAARWSDGVTEELKTYSLCCEGCLPEFFRRGRERQAACHTAPGEVLEPPGIYQMHRGRRDVQLSRLPELEARFAE